MQAADREKEAERTHLALPWVPISGLEAVKEADEAVSRRTSNESTRSWGRVPWAQQAFQRASEARVRSRLSGTYFKLETKTTLITKKRDKARTLSSTVEDNRMLCGTCVGSLST